MYRRFRPLFRKVHHSPCLQKYRPTMSEHSFIFLMLSWSRRWSSCPNRISCLTQWQLEAFCSGRTFRTFMRNKFGRLKKLSLFGVEVSVLVILFSFFFVQKGLPRTWTLLRRFWVFPWLFHWIIGTVSISFFIFLKRFSGHDRHGLHVVLIRLHWLRRGSLSLE